MITLSAQRQSKIPLVKICIEPEIADEWNRIIALRCSGALLA
jgi:hypothetical protein